MLRDGGQVRNFLLFLSFGCCGESPSWVWNRWMVDCPVVDKTAECCGNADCGFKIREIVLGKSKRRRDWGGGLAFKRLRRCGLPKVFVWCRKKALRNRKARGFVVETNGIRHASRRGPEATALSRVVVAPSPLEKALRESRPPRAPYNSALYDSDSAVSDPRCMRQPSHCFFVCFHLYLLCIVCIYMYTV